MPPLRTNDTIEPVSKALHSTPTRVRLDCFVRPYGSQPYSVAHTAPAIKLCGHIATAQAEWGIRFMMRKGFTLIELLVVVAIIAILGGLLIPIIVDARRGGLKTQDINNMRQIGMGITTYRDLVRNPNLNPSSLSLLFCRPCP